MRIEEGAGSEEGAERAEGTEKNWGQTPINGIQLSAYSDTTPGRYDAMARLPRVRLVDYPLHVVIRGNDRRPIFVGEGDRVFFHRTLGEACRKFGTQVHAYVLMPNHVHLLASANAPESISKTIQSLGRRYVGYFNFLHKRTGTLWEGRFFSCMVDTNRYFFTCQRYIELNPVRAALCRHPADYAWSSYRYYAEGRPDDLIAPHPIHDAHGAYGRGYCRLFEHEIAPDTLARIRDSVRHGWALGDDEFRERITSESGRRSDRAKTGRKPKKPELSKLESDPN